MIITRTPYRLSFFGGGTDYNPWFEEHGGLVIGSTFSKYCYITVRNLPPFFEHKSRVVYSVAERVNSNDEIEHPGIRACLQHMDITQGVEVHHDGDLPARSGIGSSSSFTVGFLMALHALRGEMCSKKALAKEAIHVEQNVEKQKVGIQDQILAAHGGMQVLEMMPGGDYNVTPLVVSKDYKKYLESHIMLAFSGMTRIASHSAEAQINNIKSGAVNNQLHDIHGIAKEALSLFEKNADMDSFGKLFDMTWQIKKTLTNNMTSEFIDDVYAKAKNAGALGGRLMGAGGGGFLFFLAPPERHEAIREALADQVKVWVPFSFDNHGAQLVLVNGD